MALTVDLVPVDSTRAPGPAMITLGVCQEASFVWVVRFGFVAGAAGSIEVCSRHFLHQARKQDPANSRANTVAAFLLIELVITTILAALAAGVNVPIVGSSDAAAKKEDRNEDGAPPKAEEQA